MKTTIARTKTAARAPRENPQEIGGPSTPPVIPRSAQDDRSFWDKRQDAASTVAPPMASDGLPARAGFGCPPERSGLYWVKCPASGILIAVCDGAVPFLHVRLLDPWGTKDAHGHNPTAKGIAALEWLGEIVVPGEAAGR